MVDVSGKLPVGHAIVRLYRFDQLILYEWLPSIVHCRHLLVFGHVLIDDDVAAITHDGIVSLVPPCYTLRVVAPLRPSVDWHRSVWEVHCIVYEYRDGAG